MNRKLITGSRVADTPVAIQDLPPVEIPFRADYAPAPKPEQVVNRLPRSWTEVAALVEQRLMAFEERHRAEMEESFTRGVEEGIRRQEAALQLRLEAAQEPWQALVTTIRTQLDAYREELYHSTGVLAGALSTAWLEQVVALNPCAFTAALHDVLEPLRHLEHIEVRLHPDDLATLKDSVADGEPLLANLEGIKLTSDSSVDRGGAVAESSGGTVDARLKVRVARALALLAGPEHEEPIATS